MSFLEIGVLGSVVASNGRSVPFGWTQHYVTDPDITVLADLSFVWGAVETEVWNAIWQQCSADLSLSEARVTLLPSSGTPQYTTPLSSIGGNGGPRLPCTTALFCQLRTGTRGRQYRGFKRLGPIAVGDVEGSYLTPAARSAWGSAAAGFGLSFLVRLGGLRATTLTPLVLSKVHSPGYPTDLPFVNAVVTAVVVNPTLSSLRHRRETRKTPLPPL